MRFFSIGRESGLGGAAAPTVRGTLRSESSTLFLCVSLNPSARLEVDYSPPREKGSVFVAAV